jgi:hypothetical protein
MLEYGVEIFTVWIKICFDIGVRSVLAKDLRRSAND